VKFFNLQYIVYIAESDRGGDAQTFQPTNLFQAQKRELLSLPN